MAIRHNNLKRILRRSLEELQATVEIAKTTSLQGAAITLLAKVDIQRMNRNGYQITEHIKNRLIKKHQVMLEYFEKRFGAFFCGYDFDSPLPDCDKKMRDRIWLCWWQGEENASDLVKACMASVRKNAGEHIVTIITEENYKSYVSMPAWIEEKYRSGIISRTHFSDLLRFFLLAEYGGVWLDASICCVKECFSDILKEPIWSIKRPHYNHISVASGFFATYSFACQYEYRWVFAAIRDFLIDYWREKDILIDYLMLDYLIALILRNNQKVANLFRDITANNPKCDELLNILEDPYDAKTWEQMKMETSLFKLTWKQEFSER